MDALISGQAGLAIYTTDRGYYSIDWNNPADILPCPELDIPRLMADASDVYQITVSSIEEVKGELRKAWEQDRSLQLTLILLDETFPAAIREATVEHIQNLFDSPDTINFVAYRLYAAQMPESADLRGAIKLAGSESTDKIHGFLRTLQQDQDRIRDVSQAWQRLPTELFQNGEIRETVRKRAVHLGIFYMLVMTGDISRIRLSELLLHPLLNTSEILVRWHDALSRITTSIETTPDVRNPSGITLSNPPQFPTFGRSSLPSAPFVTDETVSPRIQILEQFNTYGKFVIEPLDRGYGVTLGSSLRRVLLSSIIGAAVTSIKFDDVQYEFSTIPGVKEDTTELILNLKDLYIKIHSAPQRRGTKPEPKTVYLDVKGEGTITGADIQCPADVEVVNPEVYLATLSDESAHLAMELTVEMGKGYVLPDKQDKSKQTIGVIPISASFTPVRKVSFNVEATRVGFKTDFERLTLEIWTNGTMHPAEALSEAAQMLEQFFHRFVEFPSGFGAVSGVAGNFAAGASGALDARIEELDFSVRTYSCLKKANVLTIGDLLQISEAELMQIRNFGKKSLTEVKEKLASLGLSVLGAADDDSSYDDEDDAVAYYDAEDDFA